jgi:hypothetical protein
MDKLLRVCIPRDKVGEAKPSSTDKTEEEKSCFFDAGTGIEFRKVHQFLNDPLGRFMTTAVAYQANNKSEWVVVSLDRFGKAMLSGELFQNCTAHILDLLSIFLTAGLIDIGDRPITLSDRCGNDFSIEPTTNLKDFQAFFERDPPFLEVEFYRIPALDEKNLPVMPVPAMTGPYEKIRREIRVLEEGANRPAPHTRMTSDSSVLELPVRTKDVKVDVGLHFMKVRPHRPSTPPRRPSPSPPAHLDPHPPRRHCRARHQRMSGSQPPAGDSHTHARTHTHTRAH